MTEMWTGSATLDELRAAPKLMYLMHTVIEPIGGGDGSLVDADRTMRFALDLWTPSEVLAHRLAFAAATVTEAWDAGRVLTTDDLHGLLLPTEELSADQVREAVIRWCREHLGREDIEFDLDEEN